MAADWASYVGMATGIAGAVTGYLGYRRAAGMKTLDLRVEVRKLADEIATELTELPTLIDRAHKSRTALRQGAGLGRTGGMTEWSVQVSADRDRASQLQREWQPLDGYMTLSASELETRLVELHRLHLAVRTLSDKYRESLAHDEQEREFIRRQIAARSQAT